MSQRKTRISRIIGGFNADIKLTAEYIQQPTSILILITNGIRLGWTTAEIAQWVQFYTDWQPLYVLYSNKKGTRTTAITEELKKIISAAIAYDKKQHLYDRIASNPNATALDLNTFNIKGGTFLQTSPKQAPAVGTKEEVITLKDIGHMFHKLEVTSPDGSGKSLDEGVQCVMMYRVYRVKDAVAPALDSFVYFGDVKYGTILSTHIEANIGKEAGYYARVKDTHGVLGLPSMVLWVTVI